MQWEPCTLSLSCSSTVLELTSGPSGKSLGRRQAGHPCPVMSTQTSTAVACQLHLLKLESLKWSSPDFKSWELSWLSLAEAQLNLLPDL